MRYQRFPQIKKKKKNVVYTPSMVHLFVLIIIDLCLRTIKSTVQVG